MNQSNQLCWNQVNPERIEFQNHLYFLLPFPLPPPPPPPENFDFETSQNRFAERRYFNTAEY